MARSLAQIMKDADGIIEKMASENESISLRDEEDDLFKLASEMTKKPVLEDHAKQASFELTPFEKTAASIAVVETILGAQELAKIVEFEKSASERGLTTEQIQGVFEKISENSLVGRRAIMCVEEASRHIGAYCAE
jgi:hypothetical protein